MGSGTRNSKTIAVAPDGAVQLTVTVDLAARRIVFTAGTVSIEAPLKQPLEAVSFVGYAVDNAKIDFTPIEIATK